MEICGIYKFKCSVNTEFFGFNAKMHTLDTFSKIETNEEIVVCNFEEFKDITYFTVLSKDEKIMDKFISYLKEIDPSYQAYEVLTTTGIVSQAEYDKYFSDNNADIIFSKNFCLNKIIENIRGNNYEELKRLKEIYNIKDFKNIDNKTWNKIKNDSIKILEEILKIEHIMDFGEN